MKKICDMHVHTKYSCDSDAELEAYCLEAIKKGISAICFTEHVDYNVNDYGYGYYSADEFFADFLHVKEKYGAELDILCGVEFSEPHLYQDELSKYANMPYDYILGAVHYVYSDIFIGQMPGAGISAEVCYEHYWDEILSAVKVGGFDCLGHIDFPKRYYNKIIIDSDKLHEICSVMVRNDICLEINTSSLRKNIEESMPDREILSIYKSCGGKYITVGSDAHSTSELAADYSYAKNLIEFFDLKEIVFERKG
jgi:histidinol-phosphatase (PHP family)